MRLLMMMMLVMFFVFTSCNQENVVPESAAATVDNNVEVSTEDAEMGEEEEGYEDGDEEDEEEGQEIDPSQLPQPILDYISENYPNALIEEAEQYADGSYEVELDNDVELLFDSNGNFLGEGD